jgi:cobyrinic acid a,c-diamide synthase
MNRPRIVIAGTSSGSGKTTVSIGLMAALTSLGKTVQGYKVGPDYIDPGHHAVATGRVSRNLDSWMFGDNRDPHLGANRVRELFYRSSEDADISIIEGVMGLYDGRDPLSNHGSTADLSEILAAPVILVIDASSMARSAAAVVLGFQKFAPSVQIAGVLVNQVGGPGHYQLVKSAIEQECGIPALGYLAKNDELMIPERHLGLVTALERGDQESMFDTLVEKMLETVDLERILSIANSAADFPEPKTREVFAGAKANPKVTIAIAKDAAFNFYYPENLELLEWHGARLKFFSPLSGDEIPEEADGLYIGGGFPEEFAEKLSKHTELLAHFRERILDGLPTLAECGGFMFLTESITDRQGGTFGMVGLVPAAVKMQSRLAALGYREILGSKDSILLAKGEKIRGHEFHYSTMTYREQVGSADVSDAASHAYEVTGSHGSRPHGSKPEGYCSKSLLAAYTHVHFASNPGAAKRFISICAKYHETRGV